MQSTLPLEMIEFSICTGPSPSQLLLCRIGNRIGCFGVERDDDVER
jgi:hypothetical protein